MILIPTQILQQLIQHKNYLLNYLNHAQVATAGNPAENWSTRAHKVSHIEVMKLKGWH